MNLKALAAAAFLSAAIAAHADTFQYTVTFNNSQVTSVPGITTATFDVPAILTTPTTVTDLTGTSNQGNLQSVEADPTVGSCTASAASSYACFITSSSAGQTFLYFTSNIETSGVFTDFFNDGTVSVTDLSSATSTTPEPSSFLLLGSGLLGVGATLRRRLS